MTSGRPTNLVLKSAEVGLQNHVQHGMAAGLRRPCRKRLPTFNHAGPGHTIFWSAHVFDSIEGWRRACLPLGEQTDIAIPSSVFAGLYWIVEVPMKYKVAIQESDEGVSVHVPGLPGCWSQGATEEEALANIKDAICEYLSVVAEKLEDAEVREVEVAI